MARRQLRIQLMHTIRAMERETDLGTVPKKVLGTDSGESSVWKSLPVGMMLWAEHIVVVSF